MLRLNIPLCSSQSMPIDKALMKEEHEASPAATRGRRRGTQDKDRSKAIDPIASGSSEVGLM
jgi:hypothetical protein